MLTSAGHPTLSPTKGPPVSAQITISHILEESESLVSWAVSLQVPTEGSRAGIYTETRRASGEKGIADAYSQEDVHKGTRKS